MNASPINTATLMSLADLSTLRPCIIIDSREQTPLVFTRLPSVRAGLLSGDYSVLGLEDLFAVERKSVPDLVSCVGGCRERFERELHRLRGFRFKRLVIVGTRQEIEAGRYRSNVKPSSVLHSLSAWECRYDVPVIFCQTPDAAARQVESWAYWFSRELILQAGQCCESVTTSPGKGCNTRGRTDLKMEGIANQP